MKKHYSLIPDANTIAGETPKESDKPCKNRPTNKMITDFVGPKNVAELTSNHPKILSVWKVIKDGLRPIISLIGPPIKQPIIWPTTNILAAKWK